MSYKDPEKNSKYQREHHCIRRIRLRKDAIERLGGKCVYCGTVDGLEFDHIDPKTKKFEISSIWRRSKLLRETELAKCQLLCLTDHMIKDGRLVRTNDGVQRVREEPPF